LKQFVVDRHQMAESTMLRHLFAMVAEKRKEAAGGPIAASEIMQKRLEAAVGIADSVIVVLDHLAHFGR